MALKPSDEELLRSLGDAGPGVGLALWAVVAIGIAMMVGSELFGPGFGAGFFTAAVLCCIGFRFRFGYWPGSWSARARIMRKLLKRPEYRQPAAYFNEHPSAD